VSGDRSDPECRLGPAAFPPTLALDLAFLRSRHIVEYRSDVAGKKIPEVSIIVRLGLRQTAIHIEGGKYYLRPLCVNSIDIIRQECGGACDGRWLGFKQLYRKVILHSECFSSRIIGSNPSWIICGLTGRHSNSCAEFIGDHTVVLIGGTRLSACVPVRFDCSEDRIIDIH
jgi:hypothetical protein